jgi:hypothetical protein
VLAVVVGVIVVLGAAAAVFSATQSGASYRRGTPEATVQDYLGAVFDGDSDGAARHLAPTSGCDARDLDQVVVDRSTRVHLVSVKVEADTARVEVAVDRSGTDGPFAVGETEDHTYHLTRTGGAWLLDAVPWPLYDCGGTTK